MDPRQRTGHPAAADDAARAAGAAHTGPRPAAAAADDPDTATPGSPAAIGAARLHPFPPLTRRRTSMPGKKHVAGANAKQNRQYEHIKESAQKSGRYGKRAEEVAARTVNKQKSEHKKK
jgi:hypothetical protein